MNVSKLVTFMVFIMLPLCRDVRAAEDEKLCGWLSRAQVQVKDDGVYVSTNQGLMNDCQAAIPSL